jgi:hypothetical protein
MNRGDNRKELNSDLHGKGGERMKWLYLFFVGIIASLAFMPCQELSAQDFCMRIPSTSFENAAVDADHDGISDERELELAAKYAPHFIFDPREDYFYIDPKLFIDSQGSELNRLFQPWGNPNQSGFIENDGWKLAFRIHGDTWIPPKGKYPPAGMSFSQFISGYNEKSIQEYDPSMYRLLLNKSETGTLAWDHLRIRPPQWRGKYYKLFDKALKFHFDASAPVFFIVERNAEGNVELQYWQFSHCDDKNLATDAIRQVDHLCDWSRVVLVFASNTTGDGVAEPPLYAFYSCHESPLHSGNAPFNPRYLLWDDVHVDAAGHPVVLVSHNQHELYFETDRLPVLPYPRVKYETDLIRYGNCTVRPYFIIRKADHDYFDQVGNGVNFTPSRNNLINLQNGDYPNPGLPWLTFGGKWYDGPEGPLGLGAGVRFREHNIWKTVTGDDGSVAAIYQGMSIHCLHKWDIQCKRPNPNLATAVLLPQDFSATAKAYLEGRFGLRR